ncbi:MAG: hypothetical protein GEU79_13105 [Acidimicrobiia bacterium]|nr:hypothetical protein [Acidimicrobiia bacterium]
MRTTVTIDDDVAALIEQERRRTGETFKEVLNRMLRTATHRDADGPPLPKVPGELQMDISDVSVVLARLDDEPRR